MPFVDSFGVSRKIAVFLSVVAIVLLMSSFLATWYHVTIKYDTEDPVSQRISLGHAETWANGPFYLWPYIDSDMYDLNELTDVTGTCVFVAVLLVTSFVGSCLLNRKRTSIILLGTSAIVSVLAFSLFAFQVSDAINSNHNFPYAQFEKPLGGFVGSFTDWGGQKVLYGPDAGWLFVVLASAVQVIALLLFAQCETIDRFLQKRGEGSLWDPRIRSKIVVIVLFVIMIGTGVSGVVSAYLGNTTDTLSQFLFMAAALVILLLFLIRDRRVDKR